MKMVGTRPVFLLFTLALLFTTFTLSFGAEVILKAGTPIPIILEETVSSEEATTGQAVKFTVTRDVKVDGVTVIKAGSEVVAEVTHAEKSGSVGREGRVSVVARHTTAVDGTRVPLRATLAQTGQEQTAVSVIICPFIKGTKGLLTTGTETKAFVDYDTKIKI